MRTLGILFAFSVVGTAATEPALADDIPRHREPVVVSSNWTGAYGGIHLGGTWGSTGAFDLNGYSPLPGPLPPGPPLPPGDHWHADTAGFLIGGQLGYNWQMGALLLGVEGDIGDLGLNGSADSNAPFVNGDTSSHTQADFYLTARGRIGFVADHWLLYATGGYFGAETRVGILDACFIAPPCGRSTMDARDQSFRSGWTVGGGLEWIVRGPWTLKAEYLYYDLGSALASGLAGGEGPRYSWDLDTHGNIVRAGLNYRFTGPSY